MDRFGIFQQLLKKDMETTCLAFEQAKMIFLNIMRKVKQKKLEKGRTKDELD